MLLGVSSLFLQNVAQLITSVLLLDENVLVGNFCVHTPGTQSVPLPYASAVRVHLYLQLVCDNCP